MATKKVTLGVNPVGAMSSASAAAGGSSSFSSANTTNATVTTSSASSASGSSSAINNPNNSASVVQEFSVRVPKPDKPMSVMRFNGALNVDIAKWTQLKMLRDDHSTRKSDAAPTPNFYEQPDMPKFGAGSEFGREAREEARRRKYGQHKKKINAEDQPWVLKAMTSDKQTRRFKGLREGTISENASYFIFTQATDGQFEVFPVSQWYNFTPIQTYKALSAEEAEEEFGRRDKIMNYFNVMVRKRMKGDEADGADKEEEKSNKKKGGGGGGLKVSEMEDWDDVNEMESDDDDEEGDAEKPKAAKKKKPGADKKKKKKGSDSEANEDSDDGDGEGRELDYISDSSVSSSDDEEGKKVELGGVDQESGLRNLLESDSSEEENPEEKKKEEETEEAGEKPKKKKGKKAGGKSKKPSDPSSPVENLSDDSDDDDGVDGGGGEKGGASSTSGGGGGGASGSGPIGNLNNDSDSSSKSSSVVEKERTPEEAEEAGGKKRKANPGKGGGAAAGQASANKKAKLEVSSALLQTAASEGITEEAVRRYLLRKPMTATELLQKFKSKKTKVASEDMVTVIASILKKINPMKRTQSTKMYLYLKN